MHWIAEMDDGQRMLVPTKAHDSSENILRYGLKALLRRMLRSRNYLTLVGIGVVVKKFINTRTMEELQFSGTHAGFSDLFAALMEVEGKSKIMYHQVQKRYGFDLKTDPEPLDFEGSLVTSVRTSMAKINNVSQFEIVGKTSFVAIQIIDNPELHQPFAIEHYFIFS